MLASEGWSYLLTAGDGTAAEVSAGFGVDHGGNMLLRHQVRKELLAALRLLPETHTQTNTNLN